MQNFVKFVDWKLDRHVMEDVVRVYELVGSCISVSKVEVY